MKNLSICIIALILVSCSGFRSFNHFYNDHKQDPNVTAIQVPRYLLTSLSNIDPSLSESIGTIKEFRFLQLRPANNYEVSLLSKEMTALTANNFVEVYRKNNENKRTVLNVKERKDVVKEILFYNNALGSSNFLYIKGDFNPVKVRELANNAKFDSIAANLSRQRVKL